MQLCNIQLRLNKKMTNPTNPITRSIKHLTRPTFALARSIKHLTRSTFALTMPNIQSIGPN